MKVASIQQLIDLVLQYVRSVLTRLHTFIQFWKAMKISFLLVVVLLKSELYRQSYEHMKVA
jgi:hypothetical protein